MSFEGPLSGKTHDPMKAHVEYLVHKFIEDLFEMARHSLIVDGSDISKEAGTLTDILKQKEDEAIEPFDFELNNQLKDLYSQVDDLTLEISNLRRQIPQDIRHSYLESLPSGTSPVQAQQTPELAENYASHEERVKQTIAIFVSEYYDAITNIKEMKKSAIPEAKLQTERLVETFKFF